MTVHACIISRSAATGSVVSCTCGFALGPFMDNARAVEVARAHRAAHAEPKISTPESKARALESQRRKRAEKRARST